MIIDQEMEITITRCFTTSCLVRCKCPTATFNFTSRPFSRFSETDEDSFLPQTFGTLVDFWSVSVNDRVNRWPCWNVIIIGCERSRKGEKKTEEDETTMMMRHDVEKTKQLSQNLYLENLSLLKVIY